MSLIRRNREDLNNTTDTDRRSYNFLDYKRSYYKYGTEPNATIVGSFARIDEGIAIGFTASNYLTFDIGTHSTSDLVEAVISFNTGTWSDTSAKACSIIQGGAFPQLQIYNQKANQSYNSALGAYTYNTNEDVVWKIQIQNSTCNVYRLDTATNEFVLDYTFSYSTAISGTVTLGYENSSRYLANGSIDLSQSYININGERWWSGDSYTKVGSWIDDGVVSGFSTSNYLSLPVLFRPASNPWERVICFKTSDTVAATQALNYINFANDFLAGVHFHIGSGGQISAQISSNGSSWNIAESFVGTTVLSANTTYYAMIRFTGSEYQLLLSTTGEFNGEETLENSITSSTPIYQSNTVYDRLGFRSSSLPQLFLGSMDLTKCYGKINGQDWWRGTKAVKVPSSSITDFGGTKYFKNVVITKYWKEITTGSREVEFRCYDMNDGSHNYIYTPDLVAVYGVYGSYPFPLVDSSSKLTFFGNLIRNASEESIEANYGRIIANQDMWLSCSRSYENDLYIDTTTTTVVEGTPEDYTYTTEESSIIEVTADDDYDFTESIPSDDFDYYLDSRVMYNLIKRGTREYYKRELSQRDTGTYTFTLGRTYVAEILFVGNGGGGSSSQRSSRWYYTGGGSGAVFEGKVILPPDTYTLTIGTLGYSYNIDNVAGHSNGLQSTDSFLVNSSGEELIRVGAGRMGTGTGSGGAAGVLTLGSLDIVSTKKAKNGNAGGSGSSNNFALSAYDNTKTGYGAGTGSVRYAGNVYGIAGIFDLVLQTDIDNYDWYKDVGTKFY